MPSTSMPPSSTSRVKSPRQRRAHTHGLVQASAKVAACLKLSSRAQFVHHLEFGASFLGKSGLDAQVAS